MGFGLGAGQRLGAVARQIGQRVKPGLRRIERGLHFRPARGKAPIVVVRGKARRAQAKRGQHRKARQRHPAGSKPDHSAKPSCAGAGLAGGAMNRSGWRVA